MPDQNTDAEKKLQKLGQRIRQGWTKEHPLPDKSLKTVRDTVREQWELEQEAARQKTGDQPRTKSRSREPEEPDQGR